MHSKSPAVELFRKAVSAGAFLEAEQLLEMYRRYVEAFWKAATSEEEQQAISTEVSSTLEWARTATLAARSHTQRKLILLSRDSAYTPGIRKSEVLNLDA
jgi:hypothetical protein